MKWKIIYLTLIGVLTFTLTACTNNDDYANDNPNNDDYANGYEDDNLNNDYANDNSNEDALAFKLEHEELNGVPHPDIEDRIFKDMYVSEHNPFRYVEYDEIIELLENGTGIVYFGFPNCPWCRNLVPVLTDAAIEFGVEEILYRNVWYDRNILELEDGEIVETRAGHPGYYQVLDILGDLAPAYRGLYDESIRRVFVPAVVFVSNGEIISYYENLPTFQERVDEEELGGWLPMNDEEVEELKQTFINYFEILFGDDLCPADGDRSDC